MALIYSSAHLATVDEPLWFCLKARPKREHLAAAGLRKQLAIDCFSPRLKFRKMTRRGAVWYVEAMFPGYLFGRFVYSQQHRSAEHSPGIQKIVQFGSQIPTVDAEMIATLRQSTGESEVITFDPEIRVGDTIEIVEGPFQGVQALVTRLLPAKERIRVLLEFLGRTVETDVAAPEVLSTDYLRPRDGLLSG